MWARRPHKHRGNMQASHRNVQVTYAHELLTSNKWIVLDSVVYIKCLCLFSVTLRAVGALQFKIPVYNLYIWFLKIKLTLTFLQHIQLAIHKYNRYIPNFNHMFAISPE